jgi:hypothetical protein
MSLISENKKLQNKRMVSTKKRSAPFSSSVGLRRDTTDKFYTKKRVVNLCGEQIQKYVDINPSDDLIIEPSAGNGSFVHLIKKLSNNYVFLDIRPEDRNIIEIDYLREFDPTGIRGFRKIHVIGNPPFGRQASQAIKFIKKSCEFCDTVSFILPRSFKKNSMKKYFPLDFHLICEITLPKNSFRIEGKEYSVPCIFQIWERRDKNRRRNRKLSPVGFVFCKKTGKRWSPSSPDIAFRRISHNVGGVGAIFTNIKGRSENSHFFIKFTNRKSLGNNLRRIKNISFADCTSISKQELMKIYNKLL